MKTINNYIKTILLGLTFCIVASCNYLDIVPPEQAAMKDATKDAEATLGFLFSCYAGVAENAPFNYSGVEGASDEYVLPLLWNEGAQKMTWDNNTPANIADGWRWGNAIYRYIGQCHLFLQEIKNARGVTDAQKAEWEAEVQFLIAYYHMKALLLYGPCPINDQFIPQDAPAESFPGRSHFDYVTDWIVNKFDEVCASGHLPSSRMGDEWGRVTTVIVKALKARLLLYAASPLWNGKFPFRDWRNTKWETPGYGYELVNLHYKKEKWERALKAAEEAKQAAEEAGCKLFTLDDSEPLRKNAKLPLPYVPLKDETSGSSAEQDALFKQHVMLMRYVVTTRFDEGNRETIWGLANQGTVLIGSLPHRIIKNNQGTWRGGYSGVSPTLNAIMRFYTENGELPEKDKNFYDPSEWYQRAGAVGGELRKEIIKLNTKREPRFYAWIAFDGGDMGTNLMGGKPLTIDLKNSELHGFNDKLFNRDNNVTGYFNQKYFEPTYAMYASSDAVQSKPRPLIRMAELYLNIAECQAALGNDSEALKALNPVRERAGIRRLTTEDLSQMSAMEWVRNERTVEFWNEGHRFYDVRRWMIAKETMGAGVRKGLNATVTSPSFETFNTPTVINQPFKWTDRMYLLPLFKNEVYKNPQFVQAPGY